MLATATPKHSAAGEGLVYSRLAFAQKPTLLKAIQTAIQVELSTIPAYYTALLSMKDTASDAYRLTRSVLMEEMFHVYQACGLLISIGGKPILTGDAVPTYPGYLPGFEHSAMPYIALRRASVEVFSDVFMVIEKPGVDGPPLEGEGFETIGQFYSAIAQGINDFVKYTYDENIKQWVELSPEEQLKAEAELFKQDPEMTQWQDFYFGKFGGKYVKVTNLTSAAAAINEIVKQGEGAIAPNEIQSIMPFEKYGVYNHYGERVDGTFGPILGTTIELSHYYSFQKIAQGKVPFPPTYAITSEPDINAYLNVNAKKLAQAFNVFYSTLMRSLQQSFCSGEDNNNLFFKVAITIMHSIVPVLGSSIMQLPTRENGDSSVGPNAAPTFEYVPELFSRGIELIQEVVGALPPSRSGAPLKEVLEGILASASHIEALCDQQSI
ncbi:Ferritin-like [Oceanospirillum multiglobuliferum]|uniref:Iminophenyl-pyruvate dimer synthase domain-containing protein n=1 Tax=Oceanospirillum multiglobuliferum TaxID=64969 RepID=A0A1T4PZ16_9GAMM|nr:ferritin-like domain-containing protein [Oceanospirillum multiglobuliferum]OPX55445.1 hypothetical protein BTE48_08620 [Oceanospirillum multiglobuliferum]SJZ96800.1 Ferritin-like [Oceanospirillum multiglobuliferum]